MAGPERVMCQVMAYGDPEGYWATRARPDRAEVAEACAALAPFTSLADVGAGPGPLLPALRAAWPDLPTLIAIEPSRGYRDFAEPLDLAEWVTACACQGIRAAPADVYVFSHTLSALQTPDWVTVLHLALQRARRGVVWLEPMDAEATDLARGRDYARAAHGLFPTSQVSSRPCRSHGGWQLGIAVVGSA